MIEMIKDNPFHELSTMIPLWMKNISWPVWLISVVFSETEQTWKGLISVAETWFLLKTRCSRCIWDVELYARICRKWRILHHLPRELLGVFSGPPNLDYKKQLAIQCAHLASWAGYSLFLLSWGWHLCIKE